MLPSSRRWTAASAASPCASSRREIDMSTFEEKPETEIGRAIYEELLWIHSTNRRDPVTVRQLALMS